jgi:deazaflavin-dependent nitroreductase family protein
MHKFGVVLLRRLMHRIGRSAQALRKFMQVCSRLHLFAYRWTKGMMGGTLGLRDAQILLLTTTGRKTGKPRTIPLLSIEDAGEPIVIASHGGLDQPPSWWLNLNTNPEALVQIQNQIFRVLAEQADAERAKYLWPRFVKAFPGYKDYRKRTNREFPIVLLHPIKKDTSPM